MEINSTNILPQMLKKYDFILLNIILLFIYGWYIHSSFGFAHDTAENFESFYFFYNHFYFHGNIAQWMPYYSFGIPSHYWQLYSLTPIGYLLMLIGGLFKIPDVLYIFKLSILFEQQLFLLGLYLLSRKLFTSQSTIIMVCLSGIIGLFSHGQIFFDFRIFYLFPMVLYFLVRFFKEKRPEFFWLTNILILAWELGNTLYFIYLWIPIICFLFIYLTLKETGISIYKCLFKASIKNFSLIALLLISGFCIYYPLKTLTNFVEFLSRSSNGKNNLFTFLSYGKDSMGLLEDHFKNFICGNHAAAYIGILPIIVLIWGIPRFKQFNNYYKAFLLTTVGILWLSFAGIFSATLYLFPGLSYYRHIGYTYGILKILLLICAGFSLDLFWTISWQRKISSILAVFVILIFFADAFGISKEWFSILLTQKNLLTELWSQAHTNPLFLKFGIYLLAIAVISIAESFLPNKAKNINFTQWALMIALCIDIFSFQNHITKDGISNKAFPIPKEFLSALKVNQEQYQPQRTENPVDDRALNVLIALNGGNKYATVYSVAQFSSCESNFRVDLRPTEISKILSLKNVTKETLNEIMGCEAPKLRLESPLLSTISKPSLISGHINVSNFNADHLTINVSAPQSGAWLVYADSYHLGWHAYINGKEQPIHKAYGAFKAIFLKGNNTVLFSFNNGLSTICSYIIMWFGILTSFFLISLFLRTLFYNIKDL